MMTPIDICFTESSVEDMKSLEKDIFNNCIFTINKLGINPNLGKRLYNKNGRDLSKCYKLYFADAKYRIIYRKITNNKSNISKIEIVAVGERNLEKVYIDAAKRLAK